jgi:hypothetical protein
MRTIRKGPRLAVAGLGLAAALIACSVGADCYYACPVLCATVNSSGCDIDVTCDDGELWPGIHCLCTANAYTYPSYTCTEGQKGLDANTGALNCPFAATYLDPCTNMTTPWVCPAKGSYATPDYEKGNPCTG